MPINADYAKSSRVDRLYDMKDSYETYEQLRADIAAINASILNEEANVVFDNVHDSYSTAARHIYNTQGISKKGSKKLVYGIVVANSTKNPGRNIYVDVPLHNLTMVQDDGIFLKDETDLSNYEELIFFPMMSILQLTPQQGALCLVEIPENFPNHTISNPEDAVFIDLYRKDILVPLDIVRPEPVVIPGSLEEMLRNLQARAASMGGGGGGGGGGGYGGGEAFTGDLDLCGELRITQIVRGVSGGQRNMNEALNDSGFMAVVKELSNIYGIPPALLLTLFYNESAATMSPRICNKLGYCGIFQLGSVGREQFGISKEAWISKTRAQQAEFFRDKYLTYWFPEWKDASYAKAHPLSIGNFYAAVFLPAGRHGNPDDVLTSNDKSKLTQDWQSTSHYNKNKGFDQDKDGVITIRDLEDHLVKVANQIRLAGGGDGRGGTGCGEKTPSTEPGTPMAEKPSDGSLKGKKILLVGDSHTSGEFGKNVEALLRKEGSEVTRIALGGMSAYDYVNTPSSNNFGLRGRFEATKAKFLAEAGKEWDICIIAIGTNDVSAFDSLPNYSTAAANINKMFSKVTKAKQKFWISPPKVHKDASEQAEYTKQSKRKNGTTPLNSRVDSLKANASSIAATMIDSSFIEGSHVRKEIAGTIDIHFYGPAAQKWAHGILDRLKSLIK